MSEETGKQTGSFADVLNNNNLIDILKGLISALPANSGNETSSLDSGDQKHDNRNSNLNPGDLLQTADLLTRVRQVMERVKPQNDPNINLLTAVKPFLRETRQKNIGNIITLLQLAQVFKLVNPTKKDNI